MWLVLLTRAWVVWLVAAAGAATLLVAGHLSPSWLLGDPVTLQHRPLLHQEDEDLMAWRGIVSVRPSLGIWLRCTVMSAKKGKAAAQHCGVYATTGADLPVAQVVCMSSLVTGTGLASLSVLLTLLSACRRTMVGKSAFNITGALQALAGVFCTLGLAVYPLAWNSVRVHLMCGPHAGVYALGGCVTGWALYAALSGTLLLLASAMWSVRVDRSVCSRRAEDEIRRGRRLVFVA